MAPRMVGITLALLLAPALAVSPVQKVLSMMNDMKSKSLKDKAAEVVEFKKFMQFCKDTGAGKEKAVSDANDEIMKLTADIEQYKSDAKTLAKEIKALDASTDEAKADQAKSTAEFEADEADYQKTHAEYEANIQDLSVGVSQLKSMMDAKETASFLQQMASKPSLPASARKVLTAFLATSSSEDATDGAKAEPGSGGIIEMMEGLGTKMEDEKTALEQEFLKAKGAYQVVQQTLTDTKEQHATMRSHKASTLKEKESTASEAEGDLASTTASKTSDETYLKELYAECSIKSSDYEQRQKLRAGEIGALNKAIEIISGGAVAGAADKHLPAGAASLAQLRAEGRPGTLFLQAQQAKKTALASFLQAQGKRLNSRVLSTLAERVKEDPFGKIKKMVEDMVTKLMEEANEDAEHKGFCDTELGTNKMTRDQKSAMVDQLTASIEEMQAKIAKFNQELAELAEQVTESDAAVAKATAIRKEEKEKNTQTITEALGAKVAVGQALKVLQKFYESAGAAASVLAQTSAHHKRDSPVQSGASTGVVGMLEVILSDFERLEADTKESEKMNQAEYDKFLDESAQDKAVMEAHRKNKNEARMELDVALGDAKKDLKSTQEELSAAQAYYEKLKPSCVDAGIDVEDRVTRRKEEIESLQEALKILAESSL